MDRYDADLTPDPAEWLALDEEERTSLVRRHHRGRVLRLHPQGFNLVIHAAMHGVVETQIAAAEPSITGETVVRLVEAGLRRHVAIHMVGEVLLRTMTLGQPYDAERYAADLRALDAGTWLGDRMRRDFGNGGNSRGSAP